MSLNQVYLIGRVGKDPVERYTATGTLILNFGVATTERWKDQQGNPQERTEWHNVTFFCKGQEWQRERIRRGVEVVVEGKIQTEKYTDKNGIEKYITKIIARRVIASGDTRRELAQQTPQQAEEQGASPEDWFA